jgi:hypothetical protein
MVLVSVLRAVFSDARLRFVYEVRQRIKQNAIHMMKKENSKHRGILSEMEIRFALCKGDVIDFSVSRSGESLQNV